MKFLKKNTARDQLVETEKVTEVQSQKGTPDQQSVKIISILKKPWVIALIIFGLLISSILGASIATAHTVNNMKSTVADLQFSAQQLQTAVKNQNINLIKEELNRLEDKFRTLENQYSKLGFFRSIPFLNQYYRDGLALIEAGWAGFSTADKTISAIEPYSDVLGLGEPDPELVGGNAENRIKLILDTLEVTLPEFDIISEDLKRIQHSLESIDSSKYPETLFGHPIRSKLTQLQQGASLLGEGFTKYRPALEQLSAIAGASETGRKRYLVLFQNDNELRPTGGFLTAYSTIYIEDGVVTPDYSDDIYELDKRYRSKIAIPPKLGKYLTTEKYWNLRDMNIDPDFKVSMTQFLKEYQTFGDKNIDGIIAVDTELLTQLLEILGPVKIPGYGTFSAEIDPKCDCPQVVYALSEIITKPTPYIREDRKGVLGPLMREILTKAYNAPSEKNPELFKLVLNMLAGRHVQFFFMDEELQNAAETLELAGRLTHPSNGEDFFALINTNLGGAKSNLFTSYEITQEISDPENGRVNKTVEITFKNSRKGDNCNLEAGLLCLNSTLRDWTRIYLPLNSELSDAIGFTNDPEVYEENGFTVIDGFFILEPNNTAKIRLSYSIPYDLDDYQLQIWKQGGIKNIPLVIKLPNREETLTIDRDTRIQSAF